MIIWAGQHAWINRKILANQKLVFIGLISYPLYLWHWPLIVIGKAIVSDYSPVNPYTRTTTIIAVAISFVLSWLTFEFVERPIRTRRFSIDLRRVAGASAASLAAVALIAVVTFYETADSRNGIQRKFERFVTPFGLIPAPDEKMNSIGPLVVAYGDSNAQHLIPGFTLLQKRKDFSTLN